MTYIPLLLAVTVQVLPPNCSTVTVAPGTGRPIWSVTRPLMISPVPVVKTL